MICPKCRAEYRRGFTQCRDCNVALVESSDLATVSAAGAEGDTEYREPAAEPGDPSADPFCSFWKGTDLRVCTEVCTVLDEVGIPHKTIRRQDHLFNLNNQSPYEVGVPASKYEQAELAIQEAFGTDEDENSDGQRLLADHNDVVHDFGPSKPWLQMAKGDAKTEMESGENSELDKQEGPVDDGAEVVRPDAGDWYPEDATNLAWEGDPAEAREMIELSLKENDIQMRWEMLGGKPQLYVLPEDEQQAKEIVREVVEGEPPE